ncbi:MAG: hypothetical protein ACLQU1_01675 [Bryobacteraceae bacterium]
MTAIGGILAIVMWLPAMAAAEERCPWLNAATAGGVLGGTVQVTVAPASCEFVRQAGAQETTLRIEVRAVSAPNAHCGPGAEPLKAIGNQAMACSYEGKPGWTAEQVVGRVRDQAFLVRIGTNDRSAVGKTLREKARDVAEQVAGILF